MLTHVRPIVNCTACVLSRFKSVTHTHTRPFKGPLSGTTRVNRYQKGKTNLDFTEARNSEWQRHQLGCMQVCTFRSREITTPAPHISVFLQAGCPSCRPTNSVKALKALIKSVSQLSVMFYRAPAAVWTTSHTTNTWFHVLTYYFQTVFRGTVKCRWSNFFIYDSLKLTNLQDTTLHYALINLTFEILTRSPETIHETIYLWADCWPRPAEKPSARPLWSSTAQCIKHRPQNNIYDTFVGCRIFLTFFE